MNRFSGVPRRNDGNAYQARMIDLGTKGFWVW
jgi:hypothetical protein